MILSGRSLYAAEREVLDGALGSLAVDIQHVGSTAVPELPAKPILDVSTYDYAILEGEWSEAE